MSWIRQALLLLTLSFPLFSQAQILIDTALLQSKEVLILQTERGDIFFGSLKAVDSDSITFEIREEVRFKVARSNIKWLGLAREAKWLQGENSSNNQDARFTDDKYRIRYENLAYSFSAIPYPKGLAEYRNIDLLFNTIDIGVSDHLSLGAGLIIPIVFVVRGKLSFSANENIHLGLGTNGFIGLGPVEGLFVHYFAVATLGNPYRYFNVTFGRLGNWSDPEDSGNLATFGGSISFAEKWRLYADIGISPQNTGLLPSIVASWAHRRNRVELGLLGIWDGFFEPIPILSYAHRF
jgi:hypothetical protein